jgi:hypothetical protein
MPISLQFPLEVVDDWPPVGSESLSFEKGASGYTLTVPPMFISELSVGDVIDVSEDEFGFVSDWWHLAKSGRSIIWLLIISKDACVNPILENLQKIGCHTAGIENLGCYSVDVPENVLIDVVDAILNELDTSTVAVTFPSFRHPE